MGARAVIRPGVLAGLTTLCLLLPSPAMGRAPSSDANDPRLRTASDYEAFRRTRVHRATRTTEPIVVDGLMNEGAWQTAEVGGGFVQSDPDTGAPATEGTEFRILYDDRNLYVFVFCYQDGPIINSELRRDFQPVNGDQVALLFDTFDDDRNGFLLQVNPGGAQRDQQIAGGVRNANWDGPYRTATRLDEHGWAAEFAIPFTTLRFDDRQGSQRWGFNVWRISRHRNEWTLWSPAPRPLGIVDVFIAGTLEGIEGITQGRNLTLKPSVVGALRPDQKAGPLSGHEATYGFDTKYGITAGLTLDVTINTDFSHVEADTQQVNLTRFGLFFPEKREFFLENYGLFDIGGAGRGGSAGTRGFGGERDLIPFFTRSIGLSPSGEPLPLKGGARLTGRVGGTDVGLLHIIGQEDESGRVDRWSVARGIRNLPAGADVGGFALHRSTDGDERWSRVVGIDANVRAFRRRLVVSGFGMRSADEQGGDRNLASQLSATYGDEFWALAGTYLSMQEEFRSEFGYVPRPSTRQSRAFGGVRPRPSRGPIREVFPQAQLVYVTDQQNQLLTRNQRAGVSLTFHDGGSVSASRQTNFERLDVPFQIRRGITIAPGDYRFDDWRLAFSTSGGRRVAANGSLIHGAFWSGTLTDLLVGASYRHNVHLRASATWSRSDVRLDTGAFLVHLVAVRIEAALSPVMMLEGFTQYNTDARTMSSKVRYRFIHSPLSDIYVVYTELRGIRGSDEVNRTLSLKVTRAFAF